MKARVRTHSEIKQALCLNVEGEKLLKLEAFCRDEGVKLIKALPSQGGETLETLLKGSTGGRNPGAEITVNCELLVMAGFEEKALRSFVGGLRQRDIMIDLKAALTQTNRSWTLSQLAGELAAEHEYMHNKRNG